MSAYKILSFELTDSYQALYKNDGKLIACRCDAIALAEHAGDGIVGLEPRSPSLEA